MQCMRNKIFRVCKCAQVHDTITPTSKRNINIHVYVDLCNIDKISLVIKKMKKSLVYFENL